MVRAPHNRLWQGLTRRLLLGFGGVVVVLFVVALLLAMFLTSYSAELQAVHHENYDSVRYCEGMRSAVDEAQAIAQSSPSFPGDARRMLNAAREEFERNASSQLGNATLPREGEFTAQAVEQGRAVFQSTQQLLDDPALQQQPGFYRDKIFQPYQACRQYSRKFHR